jgi:SAM-dependent methyltransferase
MSESSDWGIPGTGPEIYERVFVPAMLGPWALRGLSIANPQPGEHVLDVACGTGALTRLMAAAVGPQGRVFGLDLSPDMLAVARGLPLEQIEWRDGSADDLPFEADSFDAVCCAFGLMFFPEQTAAMREMRRVLKPGGRLMVAVWGSILKCPGQMAMQKSWQRHFDVDHSSLFGIQHSLGDASAVRLLAQDVGFRDVSVEAEMGEVHLPAAEDLPRGYGAMAAIPTDESTRTAAINDVTAALVSYVGPRGLVYPIEAIITSARK